jgi:hypothetical protein
VTENEINNVVGLIRGANSAWLGTRMNRTPNRATYRISLLWGILLTIKDSGGRKIRNEEWFLATFSG